MFAFCSMPFWKSVIGSLGTVEILMKKMALHGKREWPANQNGAKPRNTGPIKPGPDGSCYSIHRYRIQWLAQSRLQVANA